ncbi:ATP-binding protein [Planococcus lenghuensis]|uniref:histidine kinase n=1 Tax=Planococcus lenghuensis TaxID=2213202 RepID=A0A1Q2L1F1_9BACL|nr:ATP-binding protein [Planococcus lenghuensis]AQQ54236.1 hypothetical protein B0X71_14775 [Planococcus lenghuensis]
MPKAIKEFYYILICITAAIAVIYFFATPAAPVSFLYTGIVIGGIGAVFSLALLQFTETRETEYLYFVLLGAVLLYVAFTPDAIFWMGGAAGIIAIFLAEGFLNARRHYPSTEWLIQSLLAVNIAMVIVPFASIEAAEVAVPIALAVTTLMLIFISMAIQLKKLAYIRFFLAGLLLLGISPLIDPLLIPLGILLLAIAIEEKTQMKRDLREEWTHKETERQQHLMDELKRTNEHQEELLALLSQNLQTPIHGIVSIAESLRQVTATMPSSGMSDQLGDIISSGHRMSDMINELRNSREIKLSGLDLNFRPVRVQAAADGVIVATKPFIKNPQVRLLNTVPADLPSALADFDRLHQVLLLLTNRLVRRAVTGQIEISAKLDHGRITVIICGTLESTEPIRAEGPDCSVVRQLIELHGSELEMESGPGPVTCYRFSLPAAEEVASLPSRRIRRRQNKQLRMMLALNDRTAAETLSQRAVKENFITSIVPTGKELLLSLEGQQPNIIILDQELPDTTAIALCKIIRQQFSIIELPVLIVAVGAGSDTIREALKAGANNCLQYRPDPEELLLWTMPLTNIRKETGELEETKFVLEQRVKERTMALEIAHMNLLTLNEEMQEVEKSRNEMLSAISHELGTPITLIHSYIQATQAGLIGQGDQRYLDMIHSKLVLLERLTEDLTDLSTYRSGHMSLHFESLNIREWLGKLTDELRADIEQSGRLFCFDGLTGEVGGLTLSGDKERLGQVFSNIIWNAVKHTDADNGEITLSAVVRTDSRTGAILENTASDGELIITIKDNGPGIPPEVLPHIFDRYFKGNKTSVKKGSGLGLAIAKEIVSSHQGEIRAESKLGRGSCFTIALPLEMEAQRGGNEHGTCKSADCRR